MGASTEGEGQVSCWDNVTPQLAELHCGARSECDATPARAEPPGAPGCWNDRAERWPEHGNKGKVSHQGWWLRVLQLVKIINKHRTDRTTKIPVLPRGRLSENAMGAIFPAISCLIFNPWISCYNPEPVRAIHMRVKSAKLHKSQVDVNGTIMSYYGKCIQAMIQCQWTIHD